MGQERSPDPLCFQANFRKGPVGRVKVIVKERVTFVRYGGSRIAGSIERFRHIILIQPKRITLSILIPQNRTAFRRHGINDPMTSFIPAQTSPSERIEHSLFPAELQRVSIIHIAKSIFDSPFPVRGFARPMRKIRKVQS
jgi:hypothetical protein